MDLWEQLLVVAAGIGAGSINAIVGSGTLITFPMLLALGVPPVTANASNCVGLFPGSMAAVWGYRSELVGQTQRLVRLGVVAVGGGAVGAVLLLLSPPDLFKLVVVPLIVIAMFLVVFGKRLSKFLGNTRFKAGNRARSLLDSSVVCTSIYGGYFGAAQGVLLMGIFGVLLADSIQRQNALKNTLAGLVNIVAAGIFLISGRVDFLVVGLIAVGSAIGGLVGAGLGRRLSPVWLRTVILIVGLLAVIKLLS